MFMGSFGRTPIGMGANRRGLACQRHMMSIRPKVLLYGILLSVNPVLRKNSINDP
jgi:hypothetical protein